MQFHINSYRVLVERLPDLRIECSTGYPWTVMKPEAGEIASDTVPTILSLSRCRKFYSEGRLLCVHGVPPMGKPFFGWRIVCFPGTMNHRTKFSDEEGFWKLVLSEKKLIRRWPIIANSEAAFRALSTGAEIRGFATRLRPVSLAENA